MKVWLKHLALLEVVAEYNSGCVYCMYTWLYCLEFFFLSLYILPFSLFICSHFCPCAAAPPKFLLWVSIKAHLINGYTSSRQHSVLRFVKIEIQTFSTRAPAHFKPVRLRTDLNIPVEINNNALTLEENGFMCMVRQHHSY